MPDNIKPNEIEIVFAHNDELPLDIATIAMQNADTSYLTKRKIQKQQSRQLAMLLLTELFKRHHLDEQKLHQIQREKNGRPFIPDIDLDFNISHSGEWVAVIFAYPKSVVGIDIEHPKKTRNYTDLLNYYASGTEIDLLENNTNILTEIPDQESRFYLSWCLREAVLKTQGVGIIKLSEVKHYPHFRHIETDYCPKGELHFYYQLPFYLSYFFEQNNMLSSVRLMQWKNHQFHTIDNIQPIIYHVN